MKPRQDIYRDSRGAVMVIGVFMSAFLVGCLWYIIGLGDAVVYRQYMQDGADATAYAAAVYQARGMNMIAMINMIMAAVLAVLVALKIAQILLIAANIASCIIAFFVPPAAAVCTATTNAQQPLQNLISKTEMIVDKILRALYIVESGIAVGMPYVAEVKSVMVAKSYGATVHGGFMVSISLIPGHLTKMLGDIGSQKDEPPTQEPEQESKVVCKDGWVSSCECDRPKKNGCCSHHTGVSGDCKMVDKPQEPDKNATESEDGKNPNEGIRWGLPVEDDSYEFLCGKAGEYVVDLVFLPFETLGFPDAVIGTLKGFVGGLVKKLTTTFPGHFCGAGGANIGDALTELGDEACKKAKESADEQNQSAPEGEEPKEFDEEECKKNLGQGLGGIGEGAKKDAGMKVPKKVYSAAENGDNYFASWGIVWGDLMSQSNAGHTVDNAAWGQVETADPNFLSSYHFAKSEYYYEPKESDGKDWGSLVEDAMWNMRWRARLRRTYLPPLNLGAKLADAITGKVTETISPYLGEDSPLTGKVVDILTDPVKQMGEQVDDIVGEKIGNINQGIIH
jgi:hypothetical protein